MSEPRKVFVTPLWARTPEGKGYSLKENNNSAQLVLRLKPKEVSEAMRPDLEPENGRRPQDNLVRWERQAAHECS